MTDMFVVKRVVLHTGCRTGEEEKFGKSIDGLEVFVADSLTEEEGYFIIAPVEKDEEKYKNIMYEAEQEDLESQYKNNRKEFESDWEEGFYNVECFLFVGLDEVEVIDQTN